MLLRSPVLVDLPLIPGAKYPCRKCHGVRSFNTHNDLKKHCKKDHPDCNFLFCCRVCKVRVDGIKTFKAHTKICTQVGVNALRTPPQPPPANPPDRPGQTSRVASLIQRFSPSEDQLPESRAIRSPSPESTPVVVATSHDSPQVPAMAPITSRVTASGHDSTPVDSITTRVTASGHDSTPVDSITTRVVAPDHDSPPAASASINTEVPTRPARGAANSRRGTRGSRGAGTRRRENARQAATITPQETVEDHPPPSSPSRDEDEQAESSLPPPPPLRLTDKQAKWITQLTGLRDNDDEEFDRICGLIVADAAVRITTNPPRPTQGPQFPRRPRRDRARPEYDAASASHIQKLYRTDRKKAFREIKRVPEPICEVATDAVEEYYTQVFSNADHEWVDPPPIVPEFSFPSTGAEEEELLRSISPQEVVSRLSRMTDTAPGPDQVRYSGLRRVDPGGHVLAQLYTRCLRRRRVPASWKDSRTCLIYKAGNKEDLSNWRPLSLGNTLGKLYSGILADRVSRWAIEGGRLSPEQKGFTSHDGCLEHNFVIQSAIDDARFNRRGLCLAFLDLANAFGSVPHEHIFGTLRTLGMPEPLLKVIKDLYHDSTTLIRTPDGTTNPIPILSGVKQGCPLSPIIFNLALEPMLRSILSLRTTCAFRLGSQDLTALAYADDVVLIAKGPDQLQELMDVASEVADWSGLTFKPAKCGTLNIDCRLRNPVVEDTVFQIQEGNTTVIGEGQHYRYLGVPTGFRNRQTPVETLNQLVDDLKLVDESLLAPWQKIDAVATFLVPRLEFILRAAQVEKKRLAEVDKLVKRLVKGWLHLPQRASAEVAYLLPSQGGAGILPFRDMSNVLAVVHAYRLLTCRDRSVRSVAWSCLREAVQRKLGRAQTNSEIAEYLSGSVDGVFNNGNGYGVTLWSRVRKASRELKKCSEISWLWNETLGELQIMIPKPDSEPDRAVVHPAARKHLCFQLKQGIRLAYLRQLMRKPDQGKVWEVTSRWSVSNHMMRSGAFTRFADWRFIHRARLDCVPLNGTRRFGNGDKRCRRCGHTNETLPHVLSHCGPHSGTRIRRHDAILDRLVAATPSSQGEIRKNRQIPDSNSTERPDLVVINHNNKMMTIIDVAVVFENRYEAFEQARQGKIDKYTNLANHFREQGWNVALEAVIVGSLGAWDPANETSLRLLRIGSRYARLMRKLIVSDTIRWSRDIYVEHLTGHRQYIATPSSVAETNRRLDEVRSARVNLRLDLGPPALPPEDDTGQPPSPNDFLTPSEADPTTTLG